MDRYTVPEPFNITDEREAYRAKNKTIIEKG